MSTNLSPVAAALVLGVGLIVAMVTYLVTKVSPGGLIVPGWLALSALDGADTLLVTIAATAATFGIAKLIGRFTIVYGKRLFCTVLLVGLLLMTISSMLLHSLFPTLFPSQAVGFVIPGLISYQLLRQRVLPTLTTMSVATALSCGVVLLAVSL